ncbi:MAG TPA: J domain-containing protein [Spirochaetota bacterium]|nr:J domain-containing protein [Spirochaetota bacterium]HOM39271.1 J domain-containing protein [Spirochaetota bacterium]
MKFKGKITGIILGLVFSGNIFGGILLAILGHFLFDINDSLKEKSLEEEIMDGNIFSHDSNILKDILQICIGVIKTKENILISEIDVIKDFFIKFFKFEKEDINNLNSLLKNIIIEKEKIDIPQLILNINNYCNYQEKVKIIHLLFAIASSDMPVSKEESDYIFDVSQKINITAMDYNILKEHFIKEELDCYKILGISKNASIAEIKKAYRKAVSELHPDKKKDDSYDNEKFQQIVTAYKELLKIKKNEK